MDRVFLSFNRSIVFFSSFFLIWKFLELRLFDVHFRRPSMNIIKLITLFLSVIHSFCLNCKKPWLLSLCQVSGESPPRLLLQNNLVGGAIVKIINTMATNKVFKLFFQTDEEEDVRKLILNSSEGVSNGIVKLTSFLSFILKCHGQPAL